MAETYGWTCNVWSGLWYKHSICKRDTQKWALFVLFFARGRNSGYYIYITSKISIFGHWAYHWLGLGDVEFVDDKLLHPVRRWHVCNHRCLVATKVKKRVDVNDCRYQREEVEVDGSGAVGHQQDVSTVKEPRLVCG